MKQEVTEAKGLCKHLLSKHKTIKHPVLSLKLVNHPVSLQLAYHEAHVTIYGTDTTPAELLSSSPMV